MGRRKQPKYLVLWKKCWVKGRNKPFMTIEVPTIPEEQKRDLAKHYYTRLMSLANTYKENGVITCDGDFANFCKMKWVLMEPGVSGYEEFVQWKSGLGGANTDWTAFNPIEGAYGI